MSPPMTQPLTWLLKPLIVGGKRHAMVYDVQLLQVQLHSMPVESPPSTMHLLAPRKS
jgi:hypothetical protein